MKHRINLKALAITAVVLSLFIPFKRVQAQGATCHSKVAGMDGTLSYDSLCVPPALKIPSDYQGTDYEKHMKLGMNFGANFADYNSALINFQKAILEAPPGSEAYNEAKRGYKAAWLAKQAQNRPSFHPYLIWLQVSGVQHEE